MKPVVLIFAVTVSSSFCACAATNGVEKTMVVQRCLATDGKGKQCQHPAESGKSFCWRHRGFVGAVNETFSDAGKGAGEAWQSTKRFSTNVWQKTKSGARSAWDGTKDAADGARVGLVELLGGKDAKGKDAK